MIAQQPSIALQAPRRESADRAEPLSLNRIAALVQVVLATRRAAYTDEDKYWYTISRGM